MSETEKLFDIPGITPVFTDCTGSTNADMKRMADAGAAEGTVLIAAKQTAGRGRLGRSFYSPEGCGLYMSILLRPKLPVSDALRITTCAAAAAAEALETLSGKRALIKWVNDIMIGGRKVCGILAESSVCADGSLRYCVLGIGVNLLPPAGGYPGELENIAGAVFDAGDAVELCMKTADAIVRRFMEYYRSGLESSAFREEYRRRSLLTGLDVDVIPHAGAPAESAHVLGIDDDFSLAVRMDDGNVRHLSSGDVSVKRKKT